VSYADVPRGRWLRGGGGRPEVDTTHLRQAVEELRLELASLISSDCLWTSKACYPAKEQGARHYLCCDVRDGEGFRPLSETVYSREAVLKSCRGIYVDVDM
jgi:hypothetical protein